MNLSAPLRRSLPFRRWDEPREAEPAYAFFARLVALNAHTSARVFANESGLNGRNMQVEECLNLLDELPIQGKSELRKATPVPDSRSITLNGHVLSRRDWMSRSRRVCSACLAESAHHRVWWDLQPVTTCPFHGQLLHGSDRGSTLPGWWYPLFDVAPSGMILAQPAARIPVRPSADAYIVGRLGFFEAISNPILDKATLRDSIEAMEAVGRYALGYKQRKRPPIGQDGLDRASVMEQGFRFFSQSAAEQKDFFAKRLSNAWGIAEILGWFYYMFRSMGENAAADVVRVAAYGAVLDTGRYYRVRDFAPRRLESSITLTQLSTLLGRPLGTTRRIVDGILPRLYQSPNGRFSPNQVQDIQDVMRDIISLKEASDICGLNLKETESYLNHEQLRPLFRLDGTGKSSDRYRRAAFVATLEGLQSHPVLEGSPKHSIKLQDYCRADGRSALEVIDAVQRGELRPIGRAQDAAGYASLVFRWEKRDARGARRRLSRPGAKGLSYTDAAVCLECHPYVVRSLAESGKLKLMSAEDCGTTRPRVDEDSLQDFKALYTTGREYCGSLGCSIRGVVARLSAVGVRPVEVRRMGFGALFLRKDVERAIGRPPSTSTPSGRFQAGLKEYLRKRRSVFRPVPANKPDCVTFRTGGGKTVVTVNLCPRENELSVEVDCSSSSASRRARRLGENEKRLSAEWAELIWIRDSNGRLVTVRNTIRPVCFATPAEWTDVFKQIEIGMQRFHDVILPTPGAA